MFRGLHIGIDHYADTRVPWLSGARRDAEALHALFADTFGEHLSLLTDESATAESIRLALTTLASTAQPDDVVVITYAGHGSETTTSFRTTATSADSRTPASASTRLLT